VLLVVIGVLAILPFALRVPDAVMRTIYPLRYEAIIRQASEENDLDPSFVAGVIYTESRFRPDAKSHRGAYGLMQLLPKSARFIQRKSSIKGDYRDPEVNVRLGTWFLGYLNDRYKGHERLMLAAYNSGEGNVDAGSPRKASTSRRISPSKRPASTWTERSRRKKPTRNSTARTYNITRSSLAKPVRKRHPRGSGKIVHLGEVADA
jgi:soluble lytic murein transglycosylase